MSTYTESLGLELITPGSQAGLWGNTTNNTFNLIDQAITGVTPLSFAGASGSTITLNDFNGASNQARAAVLNISGTASGPNTVVVPNKQKTYLVRNGTSQPITFQTASPGQIYVVDAGYNTLIFCDNNNNVYPGILVPGASTLGVSGGGTGKTTFTAGFLKSPGGTTELTTAATVALGSEVSGTLPVANGGTGQTSLTAGALLFGNGTGAVGTLVGTANKDAVVWNGSAWESTGVVNSLTAGTGITITGGSGGKGDLTISSSSSGSVTSVTNNNNTVTVNPTSGNVVVSLTATNVTNALGATPVYTTLSQTIAGTKSFSSAVISPGFTTANNSGLSSASINFYNSSYSSGIYNSIYLNSGGTVGSQSFSFSFNNGGSAVLPYNFAGNGTAVAANWSSTSDARIKENVVTLQGCLDKLTQLRPVEFSYKRDNRPAADHYGLIAQELEQVIPWVVDDSNLSEGDVQNIKSVSYTELIPILIKAVQELKTEVDALKAAK